MQDPAEPGRPKYRPDIDGLRGIAVLAVVAYHAFPDLVKAGFVGVDIFFVISGFLITSIILRALGSGGFRFREFYARRIRRIFPALIVVLTAVFALGWFTLVSDEFKRLGLHMLGGATFTSNFMLWKESGYFDVDSERKILLHLWSLAIEEQFYLFFPMILWAAHKRRARPLAVVTLIAAASFAWNISAASAQPTLDFYLPQTRVWELMVGAMLACLSFHPPAWWSRMRSRVALRLATDSRGIPRQPGDNALGDVCSIAGVYLLGYGALFIAGGKAYPGGWALLPTLGAALLISGGASAWINRRILSNRVLVEVGLISYPLYLWHWPLLSYARVLSGGPLAWPFRAALVAAAFVLAWLTYRFVEKPLRFGHRVWTVAGLAIPLAALGIIGYSVSVAEGFPSRPAAHRLETYLGSIAVATGDNACFKVDTPGWFCKVGVYAAPPSAFLLGDSHAGSLLPAFARIAQEGHGSFLYTLTKACVADKPCLEHNDTIYDYIRHNRIRSVFIVFRWSNYDMPLRPGTSVTQMQAWLDRTVAAYRRIGVHVYLFDDNPVQRILPMDTLRRSRNTDTAINANSVTTASYRSQQGRADALLRRYAGNGVTVLDFEDAYCRDGICPLVKDGRFLYGDRNHVSPDGAMLMYPGLKEVLEKDDVIVNSASASAAAGPAVPTSPFVPFLLYSPHA